MSIETLLAPKKKVIVPKWTDQVLDSYGSPDFFKKQKDRFANPIGSTVSYGLQNLFAILVEEKDLADDKNAIAYTLKYKPIVSGSKEDIVVYFINDHEDCVMDVTMLYAEFPSSVFGGSVKVICNGYAGKNVLSFLARQPK